MHCNRNSFSKCNHILIYVFKDFKKLIYVLLKKNSSFIFLVLKKFIRKLLGVMSPKPNVHSDIFKDLHFHTILNPPSFSVLQLEMQVSSFAFTLDAFNLKSQALQIQHLGEWVQECIMTKLPHINNDLHHSHFYIKIILH